jgi:recombination protein RecA
MSERSERARLAAAIDVIHVRFGEQALAHVDRLPEIESWPSGVPALDRLTGIGGLPRGRISMLAGRGTCGKTSLGMAALAAATRHFSATVVIDAGGSFDAWSLKVFGPDFQALTVVRPPAGDAEATGEAATALARAGAGFMLLLLPARVAAGAEPWLALLCSAAEKSSCVVVAVVEEMSKPLGHAASTTIAVERTGWLFERGELLGLCARLECVKNKLATPGRSAVLEVRYPLGPGQVTERALVEVEVGVEWDVAPAFAVV